MLHFFVFSVLFSYFARAAPTNITIDDTDERITYAPTLAWQAGQLCQNCTAKADVNQAYGGTWHDASYNPPGGRSNPVPGQIISVTMDFTGTAVYIYCILTRSSSSPNGNTDMTFFIDDQEVSSFSQASNGDKTYLYNQIVFSWSGLEGSTSHNVRLESGHAGRQALVMLDRIVYTTDDSSSDQVTPVTTTSSTASQQSTTSTSSSSDSSEEETSSSRSSTSGSNSSSSEPSDSSDNSAVTPTPARTVFTSSGSRQTTLPSLSVPDSSSGLSDSSSSDDQSSSNTGAIVGATLGGLGGLCLFVGLGWMCARRRKVREEDEVAQVIQPFFTRGSYAGGSHSGVGVGGSGGGSSASMRGNELVGGGLPMEEGLHPNYMTLSAVGTGRGVAGAVPAVHGSQTLTPSPTTLEILHTPVSPPPSRTMYANAMAAPTPGAESGPNQHRYAINVRSEKMRQQLQAQQAQNQSSPSQARGPQTAKRGGAVSPFSPTPLYSPTHDANDAISPTSGSATLSGRESSSPEGYTNMRERLERIRRWNSTGRLTGYGNGTTSGVGTNAGGDGAGPDGWNDNLNASLEPVSPHALLRPNRRKEPPLLDDRTAPTPTPAPAPPTRPHPPPRPQRPPGRPLTRILEISHSGRGAENDVSFETRVTGTGTVTTTVRDEQCEPSGRGGAAPDPGTSATLSVTANTDVQSDGGSEVSWQRKLVEFFTPSNSSSSPINERKRGMRGSGRTLPVPPGAPPPGAFVYNPALSKERRTAPTPPPPYQSRSGRG